MRILQSMETGIRFLCIAATVFCSSAVGQNLGQIFYTTGVQSEFNLRSGDAPVGDHHHLGTWVSPNYDSENGFVVMDWDSGNNPQNEFSYVWFGYSQNKNDAGFDIGVTRNTQPKRVADLSTENYGENRWSSPALDRVVKYRFEEQLNPVDNVPLHQKGFWWMGPKTLVYSYAAYFDKPGHEDDRLHGEYENYIVTDSNLSRDELAERTNLTYRGNTHFPNGDLYHHYYTELRRPGRDVEEIVVFQAWSIKHNYSKDVEVPVNRIQREWKNLGLVRWDYWNLGWRVNLETYGRFDYGTASLKEMVIPDHQF